MVWAVKPGRHFFRNVTRMPKYSAMANGSLASVVEFLLGKPDYFSIDGFEEYYSPQERNMLAELQRKLDIPGRGE